MKHVGEEQKPKHMKNNFTITTDHQITSKKKIMIKKTIITSFFTLTFLLALHIYFSNNQSVRPLTSSVATEPTTKQHQQQQKVQKHQCDIYSGKWIPYTKKPYYTHETCPWIIPQHDCIKFGRPDTEFINWRWKPDHCDLPRFNAAQFLELVRGKSMAFVGDSVAKNQMHSLVCLLGRVTYPVDVSEKYSVNTDYFKRWYYSDYKFTAAALWSPFLVKAEDGEPPNNIKKLYLDEPDKAWLDELQSFDYVIISAGQWFFRPFMYYEKNQLVGCYSCQEKNVTDLGMFYGYKSAFTTSFDAIARSDFKGTTFLRTFSPAHFENGLWNSGGSCERIKPFENGEESFGGESLEMYLIQIEEFKRAEKDGLRLRVMDTTAAMVLRPDGHPNRYGFMGRGSNKSIADCVHWCLPGPIDTWNEFLLQMLKTNNLADS